MGRGAAGRLALWLLLGVVIAVAAGARPALAQTNEDVYLTVTVGGGGVYTGYAATYGAVAPVGFVVGGVRMSLQGMRWDGGVVRADFATPPPYPLTALQVEYGVARACTAAGPAGRTYMCAGGGVPWAAGDVHRVRLRFTAPAPAPTTAPRGGAGFPTPAPAADVNLVHHGVRVATRDITLAGANAHPRGIWTDGTTMWVVDYTDEKLYAYSLDDGARDAGEEFSVAAASGGPYGLTRVGRVFYVTSDPGSDEAIKPWTVTGHDGSGNIQVSAGAEVVPAGLDTAAGVWFFPGGQYAMVAGLNAVRVYNGNNSYSHSVRLTNPTRNPTDIYANDEYVWLTIDRAATRSYRVADFLAAGAGGDQYPEADDTPQITLNAANTYIAVSGNTLWSVDAANGALRAYNFNPAVVVAPARGLAQRAPAVAETELGEPYTLGGAVVVDLTLTWAHTSRLEENSDDALPLAFVEYEYDSRATGKVGPIIASPYPSSVVLRGLPKDDYSLSLRLRYKWHNAAADEVKFNNPPGEDTGCTDADEADGGGFNTPGCAFRLLAGATRVSAWSPQQRVTVSSSLEGVLDPSREEEEALPRFTGLVGVVGDLLATAGAGGEEGSSLALPITILGWLLLSLAAAGGIFAVTGGGGGSVMAGAFTWLIIWAGLGPFVAGVPWPMALLPAGLMIIAGGLFMAKKAV